MATIKELLSAMIDKINGNEDKIDNIKGVPEAFDSITMTNGTDMANLTMSAEKELLFNGEAIGSGSGGVEFVNIGQDPDDGYWYVDKPVSEIVEMCNSGKVVRGVMMTRNDTVYFDITMTAPYGVVFYSFYNFNNDMPLLCLLPIIAEEERGTFMFAELNFLIP